MKNKNMFYIIIQIAISVALLVTYQMMVYNYKVTQHNEELSDIAKDLIQDFKDTTYGGYSIVRALSRDLKTKSDNQDEHFNKISAEYIRRYPCIEYVLHTNSHGINDKIYYIDDNKEKFNHLINETINLEEINISHFQDIKISDYDSGQIKIRYSENKYGEFGVITLGVDVGKLAKKSMNLAILEKYYIRIYDLSGKDIFNNSNKEKINGKTEYIKVEDIIWKMDIESKTDLKKELYFNIFTSSIVVIFLIGIVLTLEVKLIGKNKHIHELEILKKEIERMAYTDSLTGLPNRRKIVSILDEYINSDKYELKKCAVMFIDLDNFKDINDTLGHDYGDEFLIRIVSMFKQFESEKIVASRIGGDEFVIALLDIDGIDQVEDVYNKILKIINTKFDIYNKEVYTTASIGVAIYPEHGKSVLELFKNADIAMYKSKASGKNNYKVFNDNMRVRVERKLQIESLLKCAIDNNELIPYYQPQINLKDNKFYDMEVLLRWKNEALGWISPVEFIQIAEETGMIREIGEWVIRESCKQLKIWEKEGYDFKSISINISPVQLQDINFAKKIKRIVEEESVDVKKITLEITEQLLIKNIDYCNKVIRELKEIGFKISLDDFGTGYSSLSYLASLPIDTLKIDKSFIDNIAISDRDLSLLKGVINLAHSIDLKIVAEGVETEEQLELLDDLGSDLIQGYYFSKPIPSNELCKFYDEFNNTVKV